MYLLMYLITFLEKGKKKKKITPNNNILTSLIQFIEFFFFLIPIKFYVSPFIWFLFLITYPVK